jgi:hypothetical protein
MILKFPLNERLGLNRYFLSNLFYTIKDVMLKSVITKIHIDSKKDQKVSTIF